MRQQEAFRADIFIKFHLENDLLTMTLTYNHFENKFNQLRHLENPTVGTKIVKNRTMDSKAMPLSLFTVGGYLGFGQRRGLRGRKFLTIWFSCYLIPNDAISTPNSIWTNKSRQITSQPLLESKVYGANMGPNWVLSAPDGPHVGRMNLAIRAHISAEGIPGIKMFPIHHIISIDVYCFMVHIEDNYCYHVLIKKSLNQ